jgi:hypothetical protein
MKKSLKSSICVLLILCATNCLAVQDPQTSMALLDIKISNLDRDIAQIDKALARTTPKSTERTALGKKRAALQNERTSLIQSKIISKSVSESPLVRYGNENATINQPAQIDKLFEN